MFPIIVTSPNTIIPNVTMNIMTPMAPTALADVLVSTALVKRREKEDNVDLLTLVSLRSSSILTSMVVLCII